MKKILLVDDSNTILMIEKMILARGPYALSVARNGEEAVQLARETHPDLILMDVVMPKMTGFEAVQRLRQEEATRETPIIMVTTRGEDENRDAGYAVGCTDYVTKPIDGPELMTKVRNYLGE